jgi:ribosomal 50S subunit-associated protein YjgA (DUF615 family)
VQDSRTPQLRGQRVNAVNEVMDMSAIVPAAGTDLHHRIESVRERRINDINVNVRNPT